MRHATIILPHQLFKEHPACTKERPIYLVQDPHFFTARPYHRQKLAFHYATMEEYATFLTNKGYTVNQLNLEQDLFEQLTQDNIGTIHLSHVFDHTLERSLKIRATKAQISITWYESPYMLLSYDECSEIFGAEETYYFTRFYHGQRKRFDILLTKTGTPVGGKYSFDQENREPLPASVSISPLPSFRSRPSVTNACSWVARFEHPGTVDSFIYPVTFAAAETWLDRFLELRLAHFGPYQDALSTSQSFLFHSILSPLINVGLLTPDQVIARTISFAETQNVPIQSTEGFIRQILGWREFVYGIYHVRGREQKKSNFFNHTSTLPRSF